MRSKLDFHNINVQVTSHVYLTGNNSYNNISFDNQHIHYLHNIVSMYR